MKPYRKEEGETKNLFTITWHGEYLNRSSARTVQCQSSPQTPLLENQLSLGDMLRGWLVSTVEQNGLGWMNKMKHGAHIGPHGDSQFHSKWPKPHPQCPQWKYLPQRMAIDADPKRMSMQASRGYYPKVLLV
jgi:hypothetical protein